MPRRIARKWTLEEIESFASEPDIPRADAYARRVSPLIWAIWNAQPDAANEREAAPTTAAEAIAIALRPPGEPLPR